MQYMITHRVTRDMYLRFHIIKLNLCLSCHIQIKSLNNDYVSLQINLSQKGQINNIAMLSMD